MPQHRGTSSRRTEAVCPKLARRPRGLLLIHGLGQRNGGHAAAVHGIDAGAVLQQQVYDGQAVEHWAGVSGPGAGPPFVHRAGRGRQDRGQVRHLYTISALAISFLGKLRLIKCRYGSTDCLARDVKSGGDMGHGKSGRQISACHCLVSVAIARVILRE